MVYSHFYGATKARMSKLVLLTIALVFATTIAVSTLSQTMAATTFEFTATELDTNWDADRRFPTDGVSSVSNFGRDNVARLGVDSEVTEENTFRRTEGIKTADPQNFGEAVEVDLYVDSDWENNATRAGLWAVGDDGAGARDNLFGIVEFVNLEPSSTGESAQGDHEGWRVWNSVEGWTNLETDFAYDEWVTLKIELDTDSEEYVFSIDDEQVATGAGGEHFISEVFLNSYNYGLDEFPNLNNDSYAAHWHGGVEEIVEGEIISPETGEEVSDTLNLEATYTGDPADSVFWAVRSGTCAANEGTVLGNVDGFNDSFNWDDGHFTATADVSTFSSGDYCFVFNPGGNQNEVRETVEFSIVQADPISKQDCKRGGFGAFDFKNQGRCIQFVNTGRDSRQD